MRGEDSQQQVRDAVNQPGDTEVQPCAVSVHPWGQYHSQEDGQQADGAHSLEGHEDPHFRVVLDGLHIVR